MAEHRLAFKCAPGALLIRQNFQSAESLCWKSWWSGVCCNLPFACEYNVHATQSVFVDLTALLYQYTVCELDHVSLLLAHVLTFHGTSMHSTYTNHSLSRCGDSRNQYFSRKPKFFTAFVLYVGRQGWECREIIAALHVPVLCVIMHPRPHQNLWCATWRLFWASWSTF